jgi:hypothetical protein
MQKGPWQNIASGPPEKDSVCRLTTGWVAFFASVQGIYVNASRIVRATHVAARLKVNTSLHGVLPRSISGKGGVQASISTSRPVWRTAGVAMVISGTRIRTSENNYIQVAVVINVGYYYVGNAVVVGIHDNGPLGIGGNDDAAIQAARNQVSRIFVLGTGFVTGAAARG